MSRPIVCAYVFQFPSIIAPERIREQPCRWRENDHPLRAGHPFEPVAK